MRPESHRNVLIDKRCGNCRHCVFVEYKRDHLCLHGEDYNLLEGAGYPTKSAAVELWRDGQAIDVGTVDGDEYSRLWSECSVDRLNEVCDQWDGNVRPEQCL